MIKSITSYPVIEQINGKRRLKSTFCNFEDLKRMSSTNPEDFQLAKVKLIGNNKFIVTIKFTENKLVIIGDLRAEKELKVIEIDKE